MGPSTDLLPILSISHLAGQICAANSSPAFACQSTEVFDEPSRARLFFEALIADNLDLGRPENVEIIFGCRVRCDTPGTFRARMAANGESYTRAARHHDAEHHGGSITLAWRLVGRS